MTDHAARRYVVALQERGGYPKDKTDNDNPEPPVVVAVVLSAEYDAAVAEVEKLRAERDEAIRNMEAMAVAEGELLETEIERDEARAEIEKLRAALTQIAHPDLGVRATGRDAHDMAAFARAVLARPTAPDEPLA